MRLQSSVQRTFLLKCESGLCHSGDVSMAASVHLRRAPSQELRIPNVGQSEIALNIFSSCPSWLSVRAVAPQNLIRGRSLLSRRVRHK
jgi:hypothetical protein